MSGRLQETVALYRRRLLAQEAGAVATLEAAFASVLITIQPQLDRLYDQIAEKLANGESVPISWLREQRRLEAITLLITQQIDQYAALSLMQTGRMQRQAVDLGTEAAQALLRASLPRGVFWSFGIPSQSALMSFIGSLEEGSPLRKLFRGFGLKAARLVEQTLIGGLTLGWNPRRIAPMVQQALNVTRQRATLIARTEYIRAYRGSNLANYRANKDVCGQWRWTTAKQKRSCMACIMMDGTLHSLDEEMGSHPGCRCAPIPLTKDWSDILGVDSVRDTRPSIQSGKDWFLKQSQATQREMLGDARYNAWQEGQFELSDVVKKTHDEQWGTSVQEKSLKELVK